MENASKALLLAGSVLISLIIISMLVLMINSLTSYQQTSSLSDVADQLTEFNKQFDSLNRDDVRGNDLFSLANKVIDYNRRQTAYGAESYDQRSRIYVSTHKINNIYGWKI